MTKKIHLFLTMLLCAVFGMVQAQEVTLDFTTNDWGLPESKANQLLESKTFTNSDGYTITLEGAGEGNGYYFNTQGYLMLGKKGASLTLPAFNFKVSRIDVVGRSGASGSTIQNIFVGETAVSTETTGADGTNEYTIDEAHRAAGTIYTLKVLSAHNTQITKILVYKEGTPAKSNPNLAFSSSSATATLGKDFTEPVLTHAEGVTVTYSSDNTEVATVNASTGDVTLVAAGTTKITATSAETATYYAGSASYTLTVVEAQQPGDIVDGTFDFTGATAYGSGLEPSGSNDYITEDHTWTAGNVSLVTSGKYRWWYNANGNTLRFYNNVVDEVQTSRMTISVPSGYEITEIKVTGGQQFKSDDDNYDAGTGKWTGNAQSVVLRYNSSSAIQVKTVTVTYSQGGVGPQPETVYNSFAEIKQLTPKTSGKLKFNNAQVLYANGNDMYVKDSSGAIDFFKTTNFVYEAGQKLNGTAVVTYDVYNEMPEITKVEDADITATAGTATPVTITAAASLPEYICQLVKLTGKFKVEVSGTRTNYYLTDGTNSIQIYNKWHLTDFDLAQVVDGSEGTATGIVVTYKSGENISYEIALTALEYESAGLIDPQLAFSATEVKATIGEDFTEPTLTAAQDFDFGNLKFSSSNTYAATVDEGTGEVTLVGPGTTTITAKSEAYDEFLAGSASYTLIVSKPEAQPGTDKFEYVSDASTLAAGDVIILVGTEAIDGEDTYFAMSDQSGNFRITEIVTPESDGSIIPNSYVQQITLEGATDAWYLNVGDGYLYANSSSSNNMGTANKETAGDNAKAKITNEEEAIGEETEIQTGILFQGDNTHRDLRFNYNSGKTPRFACYDPEKTKVPRVKIYRKAKTGKLLGDVDGNGKINVSDVTAIIEYLLNKNPSPFIYENAYMNDDPYINMTDVTAIINIILNIK